MSTRQRQLQRRIRILKSELKMLNSYHDESSSLLKEYDQEWLRDLTHFKQRFKSKDEEKASLIEDDSTTYNLSDFVQGAEVPPVIKKQRPTKQHPEWAKKMFREIAKVTHPDRTSDDAKERHSKIFRKASEALEKQDHEELLSLAMDLAIPIEIEGPSLKPLLEKRIADIKERIINLECLPAWVWGESFGLYHIRTPLLRSALGAQADELTDEELTSEINKREKADEER